MAEKKPNCEQPNTNESGNTTPKLDPTDPSIKRPENNMPSEKSAKGSQDIRGYSQPTHKKRKTLGSFNSTAKSYEELYLEAITSKKNPKTVDEITERQEKNIEQIGETFETDGKKYVDIKDTQNRENKNINDVNVPQTRKFKYQEFEEDVIHRTKEENSIEIDLDRPQKHREETLNTIQTQKGREDVVIPTNQRSTKFNSGKVDRVHQSKDSTNIPSSDVETNPKNTNEKEFDTTAPTSSPKEDEDITTPPYQTNYKVYNAQNITTNAPIKSPKNENDFDTTAPVVSPKKEEDTNIKSTEGTFKSGLNVETNLKSKEKNEEDLGVQEPGIEKEEEDVNVKDPGIEKEEEEIITYGNNYRIKREVPTEPEDPGIEKSELDVETNLKVTEKERDDLDIQEPGIEKEEQTITDRENPNAETEKNKAEYFDDADRINTGSIEYQGKSGYRINILRENDTREYNKVNDSGEQMQWNLGPDPAQFEDNLDVVSNINKEGQNVNKHFDYSQSNSQYRYGNSVRYDKWDGNKETYSESSQYWREIPERERIDQAGISSSLGDDNTEARNSNTNYSPGNFWSSQVEKTDGSTGNLIVWSNYQNPGTDSPHNVNNFAEPKIYSNNFVNSNFDYTNENTDVWNNKFNKTSGVTGEAIEWGNYDYEGSDPNSLDENSEPVIVNKKLNEIISLNRNTNYSQLETNYSQKLDGSYPRISGPVTWSNYTVPGDERPNDITEDTNVISSRNSEERIFINKNIEYQGFEVRTNLDEAQYYSPSDRLTTEEIDFINSISKEKTYSKEEATSLENVDSRALISVANWNFENFESREQLDVGEAESIGSVSKTNTYNKSRNLLVSEASGITPTSNYNYTEYKNRNNLDVDNFGEDMLTTINTNTKVDTYLKNEYSNFKSGNYFVKSINNYEYSIDEVSTTKLDATTSNNIDWNIYQVDSIDFENTTDHYVSTNKNAEEDKEVINRNINFNVFLSNDIEEGDVAQKNSEYQIAYENPYSGDTGGIADYFGFGERNFGNNDYEFKTWNANDAHLTNRDIYTNIGETLTDLDYITQVVTTLSPDIGRTISTLQAATSGVAQLGEAISAIRQYNDLKGEDEALSKTFGNISNDSSSLIRKFVTHDLAKMVGSWGVSKDIYDPSKQGFWDATDEFFENVEEWLSDSIGKIRNPASMFRDSKPSAAQRKIDQLLGGVITRPSGIWPNNGITYMYTDGDSNFELLDNIATSPSHMPYKGNDGRRPIPNWFSTNKPEENLKTKFEIFRRNTTAEAIANILGEGDSSIFKKDEIYNQLSYSDVENITERINPIDGIENTELYFHSPYDVTQQYVENTLAQYLYQFNIEDGEFNVSYNINDNRAGTLYNVKQDTNQINNEDFRAQNLNRRLFPEEIQSFDARDINSDLYNYIDANYNNELQTSLFVGDFNYLNNPIDLFEIGPNDINNENRERITPILHDESIFYTAADGERKSFYLNNLIQPEVRDLNTIDFRTDDLADANTDPHLKEYLLPSEEERDQEFAKKLGLRGNLYNLLKGNGSPDQDERSDDNFKNLYFFDDLLQIETENFYEGKSSDDIRRISPVMYYSNTSYGDNKNFYVNNIENNTAYFDYKTLLSSDENNTEDDIISDPHLIEYISSPDDFSIRGANRDLRGKFRNVARENGLDHILFIDDLSKIEVGGEIWRKFGEDDLKKTDYIVTRYDSKTEYEDDTGNKKSWYDNFLDSWEDAILDRSENMLSDLGGEYAGGLNNGYIDPHLIEYNKIENSSIDLHTLGPKGEFYKLLSNKDNGNILYNTFNDLTLIRNPSNVENKEELKKISHFRTNNLDSDILWRDLNPGNDVKTNGRFITPRYYGYSDSENNNSNDQRYTLSENATGDESEVVVDPLINNLNRVRVYSAPSIDNETPDPEQIGWHLEDPANGRDYDQLNNEEIAKASIGKAGGDSSQISLDFFPEGNDFNTLFDDQGLLGLVGVKQDIGKRVWDDGAVEKRPFALKKPLRIQNFYQPKVNEQEEKSVDILGDQNQIDNNNVTRMDYTDLDELGRPIRYIQDEPGTRQNLLANINLKLVKKSGTGSYFNFLNDSGESKEESYSSDHGDGFIAVLKNPNDSISLQGENGALYHIPFEFQAEINGEQRAADWSTETAVGRTSEYYIWSKTNTRTLQLKTTYAALAPNDGSGWDPNFESLSIWTPTYINRIINQYRTLILPISARLSSRYPVSPPIVVIVLNNYLLTASSKNEKRYSRWVVQDVNIDPKYEMGYTETRDPIGYDVTMTLKEVFAWKDIQSWEDIKDKLSLVPKEGE